MAERGGSAPTPASANRQHASETGKGPGVRHHDQLVLVRVARETEQPRIRREPADPETGQHRARDRLDGSRRTRTWRSRNRTKAPRARTAGWNRPRPSRGRSPRRPSGTPPHGPEGRHRFGRRRRRGSVRTGPASRSSGPRPSGRGAAAGRGAIPGPRPRTRSTVRTRCSPRAGRRSSGVPRPNGEDRPSSSRHPRRTSTPRRGSLRCPGRRRRARLRSRCPPRPVRPRNTTTSHRPRGRHASSPS